MLRILHFRSIEKRALNFYSWEKVFWVLVLNFIRSLFNWIGFLNIRPKLWLFQGSVLLWGRCWLFDHRQLLLSERFMFRFFILLFFWTFFDNFFCKIIKFYFTFSRRVGLLNLIRCFYRTLILKYSSRKLCWGLVDLSLNIEFWNFDLQFRSTHHLLKRGML